VRLINDAYREHQFVEGDRIDAERLCALLVSGKFLLAMDGSTLAGCVYVEQRGERGYFGLLAVDPSRQRSGLGRYLVVAAETHFREIGCRVVDLETTNVREELPPFYRKLGYADSGTAPFPSEVKTKIPCHLITMSKLIA